MKKITFVILTTIVFGFLFAGCQKYDGMNSWSKNYNKTEGPNFIQQLSPEETNLVLRKPIQVTDPEMLKELQFMKNEAMITEEFFEIILRTIDDDETFYPGCKEYFCDMVYGRESIQNKMKEKEMSGNTVSRHRRNNNIFSSAGGTIVLRIKIEGAPGIPNGTGVPSNWVSAIDQAISAWNALNYNVKFNAVSASDNTNPSGYVNVYRHSFSPTTYLARAELLTSSGSFGSYLQINSGYSGTTPTTSARKFAMAHELGHIIGIHHTDSGSGMDGFSGISCYGSTNYTDPYSVFKSTIVYNEPWNDFTVCDKAVLNYYW